MKSNNGVNDAGLSAKDLVRFKKCNAYPAVL